MVTEGLGHCTRLDGLPCLQDACPNHIPRGSPQPPNITQISKAHLEQAQLEHTQPGTWSSSDHMPC